MTTRFLAVVLLLVLTGCARKEPSPEFTRASERFNKLYAKTGSTWHKLIDPNPDNFELRLPKESQASDSDPLDVINPGGGDLDGRARFVTPSPDDLLDALKNQLIDFSQLGSIDGFLNMIESALNTASFGGKLPLIKLLLDRGARVDALDADGLTPLLHLSKTRSKADPIPVMELLVASGADVDPRDETQGTLLMHFARQGKADAVRWLLAHGADRNARNKSGKTALEVGRRHAAIVRMSTVRLVR